ncbi:DUF2541 family protein [Vibrio sp. SM6]|uniref:DUF2541 family protein n=1 Tax=Vibrio agarilyticus TaxID=2726741 RepID=A0A7X8YFN0_9VIBR|nr:DUF2541 family protein [Vibrio agarilyticus]NLS11829.1 DUF2541 family protein [Vibrio agarilyticus]
MKPIALFSTTVLSLLLTIPSANADEKFTLGRTILLEHSRSAAKIPLLVCRYTNAFQIKAEKDLKLRKVVVKFQNGDDKTYQFYSKLNEDEHSRWRYFGRQRCVKSIDVYGNSEGSTAGVRVYGKERD